MEIMYYQHNLGLCCCKICCLSDEIKKDLCWQMNAVMALQEGMEAYLVGLFDNCVLEAIHGHRITVMPKYIYIACRIGGETYGLSLYRIPTLAEFK